MSTPNFLDFKKAVLVQVELMTSQGTLLRTVAKKEELQELYLESFPEGTNPIHREKRVYDGNYDLNFIGQFGGVVTMIDGKLVSVWDIEVGGYYQTVINALREFVHNSELDIPFLHFENKVGVVDHNFELLENGGTHRWDHFFAPLPKKFVMKESEIATHLNNIRGNHQVLNRSLLEINLAAIEIVLELIDSGNLYRGDEMKGKVDMLLQLKKDYDSIEDETQKKFFVWDTSLTLGAASRVRNSSIGTLLVDISEGRELEDAVASFEDKVSEGKYKRSSAVLTTGMIKKAQAAIAELGLEEALYRRYARLDDLTINNVLFADRSARKAMNPFDELLSKSVVRANSKPTEGKEISIDEFMKDVIPFAACVEVLFENKHVNNLVSLIAPEIASAGNMLNWDNNFSWSYRGEVTDSIRERVQKAGGNVQGILRCSLSWKNTDDLDIHVEEPDGNVINFSAKHSRNTDGQLDIDMNAYGKLSESAVENIFWKKKPMEGTHKVKVHNYTKRCTDSQKDGFEVEVDDNGESTIFNSEHNPRTRQYVPGVEFNYREKDGVT